MKKFFTKKLKHYFYKSSKPPEKQPEEPQTALPPPPPEYTWEKEGISLTSEFPNLLSFTPLQKEILRNLLYKDILPDKYKPDLWLIASGAKRQMLNNPNYYNNLVHNFPSFIPCPAVKQIELDLPRTFPRDPYFEDKDNIQKLKNICLAYSIRNINVGYCQGFNFIIGRFLKYYNDEEKAFWLFAQFIEDILPCDYFMGLCGAMIDTNILMNCIEMQYTNLSEKFRTYYYNTVLTGLVSCFIHIVHTDISEMILSFIFMEGSTAMYDVVLALIRYLKAAYENVGISLDFSELNTFNTDLLQINNVDTLTHLREAFFNPHYVTEFTPEVLESFRERDRDEMIKEVHANCDKKQLHLNDNKVMNSMFYNNKHECKYIQCNKDWPLCLYDRGYRFEVREYFVFKTMECPVVVDDYFNGEDYVNKCKDHKEEDPNANENEMLKQAKLFKDLLIQRRDHLCDSDDHFVESTINAYKTNDVVKQSQIVEMKNTMNMYKDDIINEYENGIDITKASKIILEKKNLYSNDNQLPHIIEDTNEHKEATDDLDNFINEFNSSLGDDDNN